MNDLLSTQDLPAWPPEQEFSSDDAHVYTPRMYMPRRGEDWSAAEEVTQEIELP